jgi:hypothetical protein
LSSSPPQAIRMKDAVNASEAARATASRRRTTLTLVGPSEPAHP